MIRPLQNSLGLFVGLMLCAGSILAQSPAPTTGKEATTDSVSVATYARFRNGIAEAIKQAEAGNKTGAQAALRQTLEATTLPVIVPTPYDDKPREMFKPIAETPMPPSLPDANALPFFVLQAQVLSGDADGAKATAQKQAGVRGKLDAMTQVALIQAGRYEPAMFFLPELRDQPPAQYQTPVTIQKAGKKMTQSLKVTRLQGNILVPALDATPLQKAEVKADSQAAFQTLRETLPLLEKDTEAMALLSEMQAKLGDKEGAKATLLQSVEITRQNFVACRDQKKDYCDVFRQSLRQSAATLEQLGDKAAAERTLSYTRTNTMQTLLTIFGVSTLALFIIFLFIARAR